MLKTSPFESILDPKLDILQASETASSAFCPAARSLSELFTFNHNLKSEVTEILVYSAAPLIAQD